METFTVSLVRVAKLLTAAIIVVVLATALAVLVVFLMRLSSVHQPSAPQNTVAANTAPARSYAPPAPAYVPPPEQVLAADTRLLPEKQFWTFPFTLTGRSRVTVHVNLKGGVPAIDSYVLSEQGFNAWEAWAQSGHPETLNYYPRISMAPLVGEYTRTGILGAGNYTLVIDNSNMGAARLPFHIFRHYDALIEYRLSVQQLP
ncbi:MAG: hypothetical protein ACREHF_04510 [Rhizomicrobium sp.]